MNGGFSPWGSWEEFQSILNRKGFAWKNLIGQDKIELWTPTMTFGNGSTGITYATQDGVFLRTGNLVTCNYRIVLSSKGSSTGVARIAGLPFTSSTNQGNNSSFFVSWQTMAASFVVCAGLVGTSSNTFTLRGATAATANFGGAFLNDTHFNNTSEVNGAFIYFA